MSGSRAKTNFPFDPKAPWTPSTNLLSSSLIAKLRKFYYMSNEIEPQPQEHDSPMPSPKPSAPPTPVNNSSLFKSAPHSPPPQSFTCLRLDPEKSNVLGIWQKHMGPGHDFTSNWVMTLELDDMMTYNSQPLTTESTGGLESSLSSSTEISHTGITAFSHRTEPSAPYEHPEIVCQDGEDNIVAEVIEELIGYNNQLLNGAQTDDDINYAHCPSTSDSCVPCANNISYPLPSASLSYSAKASTGSYPLFPNINSYPFLPNVNLDLFNAPAISTQSCPILPTSREYAGWGIPIKDIHIPPFIESGLNATF
ncbi:hypothetical protein KP509_13G080300 [Ceratopteris richardii]|nr:hypothetical protein KP509_13G080300 [Ceratopteris richardii]